ncbi:BnaCnng64210D [Brassica napus]|uniref:BnaCnng64210D protein n=1 Tax=Brassica napus TaxID=3708 RepID=A0A078JPQ7_BRANA|nr:BnaCnng64210D [Brassica napus]
MLSTSVSVTSRLLSLKIYRGLGSIPAPLYDSIIEPLGLPSNDNLHRSRNGVRVFDLLEGNGITALRRLYNMLLKECTVSKRVDQGKIVHAHVAKSLFRCEVVMNNTLLNMYAKCGSLEEARKVFDKMLQRDFVTWTTLISGYSQHGRPIDALVLFIQMLSDGFIPNEFTPSHFSYSSIFGACSSTGFLEQGKWVHAYMIKSGEKLVAFAGNTLIDMYAKSGSIHDARKIFDRLAKRDVVSWNSLLTAYAQHGFGREAVCLFEEMRRDGITPNEISFLSVLTACSHSGLLDEGWHYFELMKRDGIVPKAWHYVTIVDLLGRSGDLDRALRFIREMPIEPTAAIWKALLNACRMHKNVELGAYAAEHVFELDPDDPGPHVILYNIYASGGRWNDAARVRKKMKENGIKKEPACSWVEIENAIHMFVANDERHPQREEISRKWEEIYAKIKDLGYVPDTSHVVVHVDQQEREVNLQYHSEKIALAFALLNTPPGSTIHIKKNIRVCGDCHSAIKLVSKVVEREIIVRDTNRFHHFRDGSCSCGDYW